MKDLEIQFGHMDDRQTKIEENQKQQAEAIAHLTIAIDKLTIKVDNLVQEKSEKNPILEHEKVNPVSTITTSSGLLATPADFHHTCTSNSVPNFDAYTDAHHTAPHSCPPRQKQTTRHMPHQGRQPHYLFDAP